MCFERALLVYKETVMVSTQFDRHQVVQKKVTDLLLGQTVLQKGIS